MGKKIDEYHEWQRAVRRENGLALSKAAFAENWKTWTECRELVADSQVGFCKKYCIHPQVLDTFEKGPSRREFTPYLREVWADTGMTEDMINHWEELLEERRG